MSNRQLEERGEREFHEWVASELGLTHQELDEQEWSIDETVGHEGAVYGHTVTFDEGSDPEVLAKIEGLQDGRWVRIGFPPDPSQAEGAEP